ncbi:MAG: hypothetical protein IPO21_21560 [Bacteroidales bacterium]|nr:hypothetical protein [Bacteroidales bacterium]
MLIFLKGVNEIFNKDGKKIVTRYYQLVEDMINTLNPPIIGHLDKIKMFNINESFFSEKDTWYHEIVERLLDILAEKKIVMEINTRGFYKKNVRKFYPSPWIMNEAKKRNVPVMINSDCHHPEEMIKSYKMAAELLLDCGYKKLTIMKAGEWNSFDFNRDGIKF